MRLFNDFIGKWVQVYSVDAGIFVGRLLDAEGAAVKLDAGTIRVWYWEGAASRSELADKGPSGGTIPAPSERPQIVLGVCEVQLVTESALAAYRAVPKWSAK